MKDLRACVAADDLASLTADRAREVGDEVAPGLRLELLGVRVERSDAGGELRASDERVVLLVPAGEKEEEEEDGRPQRQEVSQPPDVESGILARAVAHGVPRLTIRSG